MKRWVSVSFVLVAFGLVYAGVLFVPRGHDSRPHGDPNDVPVDETPEALPPATDLGGQPALEPGQEPAPIAAEPMQQAHDDESALAEPKPGGNPTPLLVAAFASEPRDPAWADATEREVRGLLGGGAVEGDPLRQVSCRKRVCQIQLRWTDANVNMTHLNTLVGEHWAPIIGLDHPADPSAARAIDLYIIRKGYTLDELKPDTP